MMDHTEIFSQLEWHDGRVLGLQIALDFPRMCEIKIDVSLLESLETNKRNRYSVIAKKPVRFFSNMDISLMEENFKFGNIADGKLYQKENKKLLLIFAEGYLEVIATDIQIVREAE